MKVMFDTNIYVLWIREQKYGDLLLKFGTVKYLSSIALMELWAGAKTKQASRLVEALQKPYLNAGRVIPLTLKDYIVVGQIISGLPASYKHMVKMADFLNDVQIALTALSVGATLYTNNRSHFKLINKFLRQLKVLYV
jgi:predicted nucleic acid-binding protein